MSWFEKHLNWTFVLSQIVGFLIIFFTYITAGGYAIGSYAVLILYLLWIVSPFVVGGWVLKKNRVFCGY